ncbi:MAG TPA: hypothetical protein VF627_07620 [Abditibacterium sp.]|jgi:hypothetical protein
MIRNDVLVCVAQLETQNRIGADDDRDLWIAALGILLRDAEYDISLGKKRAVWIDLGACPQWLRPHQLRETADGGFAYPASYNDGFYDDKSVPQCDWSVHLRRNQAHGWRILTGIYGRRSPRTLDLRVTFPTRTARHPQAVIHTLWTPGTPAAPRQKRTRFYGFRRQEAGWELRATMDDPDNEKEKP